MTEYIADLNHVTDPVIPGHQSVNGCSDYPFGGLALDFTWDSGVGGSRPGCDHPADSGAT